MVNFASVITFLDWNPKHDHLIVGDDRGYVCVLTYKNIIDSLR